MSVDALFREFLTGRRSFIGLTEGLAAIVATGPEGVASVHAAMNDLVNRGRLPRDLALNLQGTLGYIDPPGETAATAVWLDPPTEPRSLAAKATDAPMPDTPRRGSARPPEAAATLPLPKSLHSQVDDVILSALTSDFQAYRRRDTPAQPATKDDRQLDAALESFRGARLRRDAAKASDGSGRGFDMAQTEAAEKTVGLGTILKGRFVLDREIGRGGMGVVYRAVDRRRLEAAHQQPYVAVKLLSGAVRRSAESLRALEAEARRAQELAHPNIVTIFDFDRDGGTVFIVMELLQGRPLDAILNDQATPGLGFQHSRHFVEAICSGLTYAHRRGVIHCDLKPANIFVTDTGAVKILDFGLAIASRGGKTEPALLSGYTVAYASPEILDGVPPVPADDVYALGCLVYVMLTGRHPFGSASAIEARDGGTKPERPPHIPGGAWAALRKALAFDRAKRQVDAEVFWKGYSAKGAWEWLGR